MQNYNYALPNQPDDVTAYYVPSAILVPESSGQRFGYLVNEQFYEDVPPVNGDNNYVEFSVYAKPVGANRNMEAEYDTYCQTPTDSEAESDCDDESPLQISLQKVPHGYIINSNVYLPDQHWHTLISAGSGLTRCLLCDLFCSVDTAHLHYAGSAHTSNLSNTAPLRRHDCSIARKIKNMLHCGVCNQVCTVAQSEDHFASKMHENNLLFAINKATDILYNFHGYRNESNGNIGQDNHKMVQQNDKRQERMIKENASDDCYYFNINNIRDTSTNQNYQHYDSSYKENENNNYIGFKNDMIDDEYMCDYEQPEVPISGISYAKMAKKPKIEMQQFIEVELDNKKAKVRFDSWHMIITPEKNRFYCMVCKQRDHIRLKPEHCLEEGHLNNLKKCEVVEAYQEYFIRKVDDKLYHCGHCNNLQMIHEMIDHVEVIHPRRTRLVSEPNKSPVKTDSDPQQVKPPQTPTKTGNYKIPDAIQHVKHPQTPTKTGIPKKLDSFDATNTNVNLKNPSAPTNATGIFKKPESFDTNVQLKPIQPPMNYKKNESVKINLAEKYAQNAAKTAMMQRNAFNLDNNKNVNNHPQNNTFSNNRALNFNANVKIPPTNVKIPPTNVRIPPTNVKIPPTNFNAPASSVNVPPKDVKLPHTNVIVPANVDFNQRNAETAGLFDTIVIYPFECKMVVPILSYNVVLRRDNDFYCGLCDFICPIGFIKIHICEVHHIEMLNRTPYIKFFSYHLIRAIREAFHCTLCNNPIPANKILSHSKETIHKSMLTKCLKYKPKDLDNQCEVKQILAPTLEPDATTASMNSVAQRVNDIAQEINMAQRAFKDYNNLSQTVNTTQGSNVKRDDVKENLTPNMLEAPKFNVATTFKAAQNLNVATNVKATPKCNPSNVNVVPNFNAGTNVNETPKFNAASTVNVAKNVNMPKSNHANIPSNVSNFAANVANMASIVGQQMAKFAPNVSKMTLNITNKGVVGNNKTPENIEASNATQMSASISTSNVQNTASIFANMRFNDNAKKADLASSKTDKAINNDEIKLPQFSFKNPNSTTTFQNPQVTFNNNNPNVKKEVNPFFNPNIKAGTPVFFPPKAESVNPKAGSPIFNTSRPETGIKNTKIAETTTGLQNPAIKNTSVASKFEMGIKDTKNAETITGFQNLDNKNTTPVSYLQNEQQNVARKGMLTNLHNINKLQNQVIIKEVPFIMPDITKPPPNMISDMAALPHTVPTTQHLASIEASKEKKMFKKPDEIETKVEELHSGLEFSDTENDTKEESDEDSNEEEDSNGEEVLEETFDSVVSEDAAFDFEENVYLKLKNTYIKISNTSYNTLVAVGDGSRYCFVCSEQVEGYELQRHVDSRSHVECLDGYRFLDKYEDHLLRQNFLMYHCGICNVMVTRRELKPHLDWTPHIIQNENTYKNVKKTRRMEIKGGVKEIIVSTQKEDIYLNEKEPPLKISLNVRVNNKITTDMSSTTADVRVDVKKSKKGLRQNKIIIFNDMVVKVPWESWNGITHTKSGYKCILCQRELKALELDIHCRGEWHSYSLVKQIDREHAPALIRKINESTLNCIVCNTELPNKYHLISEHVNGKKHGKQYELIVNDSAQATSYDDCDDDVFTVND